MYVCVRMYVCISECADHLFGRECSKVCHCYRNLVCNKTNGHCLDGCALGFTGQARPGQARLIKVISYQVCSV